MTEEEAKTKVCPRTMRPPENAKGIPVAHCIGSACMAWRHFPPEEWA